ncbi:AAA family ATPase [Psychrobacter immobilis]|uniref:AAA family ATPase n=1 Tax=Psychrobacter immobilis TaxID=498 RepID=UPI00191AC287|nr:AAA family ATPase [Psychrobacter immobilis]
MRLIELRLKNLNSLKGEWHIDFSDAAFVNEGIFAITGQTGAGKTTILDAICLALYSQTPRLGDITGSTNEIMTQGMGECSAEVIIEIDTKRYQCSWYQHRAHKKAKGNLLPIKHEISEVKTGKILEEKKSKTSAYIQDLIGMDFNQFTRSIMLAQGSFAAFLKSDIGDRAAILEKITGTDIYAKISLNVHEKKRDEEEVLSKLQYGLDGLMLLDTDDENALKANLQSHQDAQYKQQKTIQDLSEKIKWLDSVAELTEKLSTYHNDLAHAQQAKQDFIDDAKRLSAANKALEIDSQFSQLVYSRDHLKRLQNEQQQINQTLPQQQDNVKQASTHLKQAQNSAQASDEEWQSASPKIKRARVLDADIAQLTHTFKDTQQSQQTLTTSTQGLRQEIGQHQQDADATQKKLVVIEQHLNDATALNDIDSDIANFKGHCSRLKLLLQNNAVLANDNLSQKNQIAHHQTNLDVLQQQQGVKNTAKTAAQDDLTSVQQQQAALIQAQSLTDIRDEQEQIDTLGSQLEQVHFKTQRLNELSVQSNKIEADFPVLHDELATIANAINRNESAINDAKDKRQDKQTQLHLLQKVAKLEDYISDLKDGHPCPLCGALEHPYSKNQTHLAQDNEVTQTQQQITALDATIADLDETLSELRINQATKEHRMKERQEQQRLLDDQIQQLDADISQLITAALSKTKSPSITTMIQPLAQMDTQADTLALLDSTRDALATRKNSLKMTLSRYETLNDSLNTLRHTIDGIEKEQYKLASDISEIENNIKVSSLTIDSINKKSNDNFSELKVLQNAISQLLTEYLFNKKFADKSQSDLAPSFSLQPLTDSIDKQVILTEADYDPHIDTLRQYHSAILDLKNQLNGFKEERQTLKTVLDRLETQIETKQTQLDKEEHALSKFALLLTEKTAALEKLKADRHDVFADNNPEEEDNRLRAALEQAQTTHVYAQRQLDSAEYTLKQLLDKNKNVTEQITPAIDMLDNQETVFQSALIASDFIDEADFTAARLPIDERNVLSQQQQHIDYALKQAQSLLADTQKALKDKQAKPPTTDNRESLIQRQVQVQDEVNTRIEAIGAISQQLKANDEKKDSQQAQHDAIGAQKQKLQVWQQLHKLIGSSDGKKYRTFAQGLTFDLMVNQANTKLHKMSDRYLLIRDDDSPLELNVIDNYQGGEIRSTKNLSGGEGFIISLALALGLSQMASQNIRVDSLFLDEGFGTLDEESLDIALDTLTSLQQEGKLIGVISHVQALKDRILTQIKVEKLSGGFSQITGQGCQKIVN